LQRRCDETAELKEKEAAPRKSKLLHLAITSELSFVIFLEIETEENFKLSCGEIKKSVCSVVSSSKRTVEP